MKSSIKRKKNYIKKMRKKEPKIKSKIESEKNGVFGPGQENEIYESSIMSRSQEIPIEKPFFNNK